METPLVFPQRFTRALLSAGLSRYRLAQLSGVPAANISSIELGKRTPTEDQLARIAPHLGVELTELLAWADFDRLGPDRAAALADRTAGLLDELRVGGEAEWPFAEGQHPPTAHERSVIQEAEAAGLTFGLLSEPGFWSQAPDERRNVFRHLERMVLEARRLTAEGTTGA
jgi:transcriptional regulator with XRE-family HTH domain